jgi:hypothetical protein
MAIRKFYISSTLTASNEWTGYSIRQFDYAISGALGRAYVEDQAFLLVRVGRCTSEWTCLKYQFSG